MSIVIDLYPGDEAAIHEHAASVSMDAHQYLSRWVGILANNPELAKTLGEASAAGEREAIFASAIRIEALRRDIAEFGSRHKLPSFPDEALTREAIYQNHP